MYTYEFDAGRKMAKTRIRMMIKTSLYRSTIILVREMEI